MFRLSHFMRALVQPTPPPPPAAAIKPVVIWNLTRRCNLRCRHCYAVAGDVDFPGELTHRQAVAVIDDLAAFGVPALILSGGEPLLRRDLFALAAHAKARGLFLALSTNGTHVDEAVAQRVAGAGFDYVGISLDGVGATHDRFRGAAGAFDAALAGVRALKARGVKLGLRFTLTRDNAPQLPDLIALAQREGVGKFYLSHLVYAGRGDKHRGDDSDRRVTREAIAFLVEEAHAAVVEARPFEIVTGNNDADAVYFLRWAQAHFPPANVAQARALLEAWGGNAAGLGVANIDSQGDVHPDSYWSGYRLGTVKERPFSAIWQGGDPLLAQLRRRPRPLRGRCGACAYRLVCGGNTRIRALQLTGDPWAEDPACYLDNQEIGLDADVDRLNLTAFRGKSHDPVHRYS
ncbi:MAG: heme d1 biosynthesis radical SAM protein NirJ [Pseudomonadota bacterium]